MNNLFYGLLLGELFLNLIEGSEIYDFATITSPRSPNRKTKSPGFLEGSSPLMESSFIPTDEDQPSKRTKMVKIVSAGEFWSLNSGSEEQIPSLLNENAGSESHKDVDEEISDGLEKDLAAESLLSLSFKKPHKSASVPTKPILKPPKISVRKQADLISMFKSAPASAIIEFYSQGTQLVPSPSVHNLLKGFINGNDNLEREKLGLIYAFDKFAVLDFLIKSRGGDQIRTLEVIDLAYIIFPDFDLSFSLIETSLITTDSFACRAQLFLHAVDYSTDRVYTVLNDLLDDESIREENSDYSKMAHEIITRFYLHKKCPLSMSVIKENLGYSIVPILNFDPEECDQMDEGGRTIFYYAANEGPDRLKEISFLNSKYSGKRLAGASPLIGAALSGREDSIEYLLNECKGVFEFTTSDFEEAALASAFSGSTAVLKMLKKYSNLDLYCYRGSDTLLSVALMKNQIGYANLLVKTFNYNVNFAGEDVINPEGSALVYLLDKHQIAEFFLQKGANRNIRIPVQGTEDQIEYITLDQYLETSGDEKLRAILDKFK